MQKYVKIDENYKVIEVAPTNKGSVSNYNSVNNDAQLKADGYSYEDVIFYVELSAEYVVGHEPAGLLEVKKAQKTEEIKLAFIDEIEVSGTLVSSIDDFVIDARRVDVQNIQGLIDTYTTPTIFMGKNGPRNNTTLEELNIFKQELIKKGQELYYKKWQKEEEIKNATLDNIGNISWED